MGKDAIKNDVRDIDNVPTPFDLCEFLSNWAQEFEGELSNAALTNSRYHEVRIKFARWFYEKFVDEESELSLGNMYSAEATSMAELGDIGGAEKKFEELTKRLPKYVWGWIHWSDIYWLEIPKSGKKNYEKAESILAKCLQQDGLDEQERKYAEERLEHLRRVEQEKKQ